MKRTGVPGSEVLTKGVVKTTGAQHVRKLAADLSGKTGVREEEVLKVLECLGVSSALDAGAVRKIELGRVQTAVRDAMAQVMM